MPLTDVLVSAGFGVIIMTLLLVLIIVAIVRHIRNR